MHHQKIGNGKRIAGLNIMSDPSSDSAQVNRSNILFDDVCVSISLAVNKLNAHTWHHRLGHLSFQKLALLNDQLHLSCDMYRNYNSVPYNICPLEKKRRLSFVSNNHLCVNAFDLIQ